MKADEKLKENLPENADIKGTDEYKMAPT